MITWCKDEANQPVKMTIVFIIVVDSNTITIRSLITIGSKGRIKKSEY